MTSVETRAGQLLIDGEPRLVIAGEIHYFRVPRDEWADRLDLAVEAGCNAVASYIPWLLHELPDGTLDVTGDTRDDRDVGAFIDLCAAKGLWFIARPGPFVMAELMNEGLPFRLYREHPELVPVGWDGVPTGSRTLDYLHPAFLAEVRRWYATVLPRIYQRLAPRGGNVIAVQLDNEVGMLAWVTNSPDLTGHLLADFRDWLDAPARRASTGHTGGTPWPDEPEGPDGTSHGATPWPALAALSPEPDAFARAVRSPEESWAGELRAALPLFMRDRFARYLGALRDLAHEFGVHDVPLLVNLHGTAAGSAEPFPIGISQLVETYSGLPGMVAGSDHYVGEMTLNATTDLYVINAFQAAVNGPDQPLTSVEFEAGSGDYGNGMDVAYDPSTVELKTRLFLAQGNRLINYYLFAGGHNRPLEVPIGDGIDRIAFTGERHGFAAPVGPEGQRGLTFEPTSRAGRTARTLAPWLSRMRPEPDSLQLGLVLDAYASEYHHPGSALMTEITEDLTRHRGAGPRRALARSTLLLGYQFDAVWLERSAPRDDAVLMLSTGRFMDAALQRRLAAWVRGGGRLLLLGRLPEADLAGRGCTVLADALGLRGIGMVWDAAHYFPTARAAGWTKPWPDTRVGWLQRLAVDDSPGAPASEVVLTDCDDIPCGVEVELGRGRVVFLAAELPSNLALFGRVLDRFGVRPRLRLETEVPGVFGLSTVTDNGQRLLHLLNVTGYEPEVVVSFDGLPARRLRLPVRAGVALPVNLATPVGVIEWADAELVDVAADRLAFGPGLAGDASSVRLRGPVTAVEGGTLSVDGEVSVVTGQGPFVLHLPT
ncbi:beta-galactosidase [Micropruina sonneratiae]|uniref:beta-galactosidase n=1 Tax=Micropruina sonneratiae TaxID=2986940 RepID=UPI002227EECC|nr:beta-galactosidase [Micropruina sp. KQZ13P-5]MCW3158702.1 beta-galactosidase [Micropruina sp. KQZ13P-5]